MQEKMEDAEFTNDIHFLFAHPQFFHIDKVELEFILEHHDSTISLLIVGN
jgi:hypothetical protein